MITFFRKFFGSKLGLGLTLGFLGLIAFAFASSDVANTAVFGGVSGGDRVAVVGDEKIGNADFSRTVSSAVDQVRRENPTITIPAFVEQGGLDTVLQQMIDRTAVSAYAREYGLRAGDNLINSEILQISAFRGPDGNFSQDAFLAALRQQGLNEAMLRRDLGDSLLAQQLLVPALSGTQMPQKLAMQYAALLRERREGAVGFLPSAAFAPTDDPTDEQINAFYRETRENYVRPERRTIRYATFGVENLDTDVTPTAEEIAARFERDSAEYAAREERSFTQLIVPTEEAANALRQRVSAGASLAAVAREAGFSTTQLGPIEQSAYADVANAEVAQAVFAAAQGQLAEPARSALGWHVVRVDRINRIPARSLAQVTPEITEELLAEKRAQALADMSARVEEQLEEGVSFSQMAANIGVEVSQTAPLTADGRIYDNPAAQTPPQLRGAISTAFQMEEGEPQLAELVRGTTYMLFEVSEVTASAAAPLSEIRQQVVIDWRLAEGAAAAKEAADRVIGRVRGDTTLAAAMREEEVNLPPVDNLSINREELLSQGQQIPPALALFFSMAQGTTKRLEAPGNIGWFVVDLDKILTGEVQADDPIVASARQQLRGAISDELAEQLTLAIREELGVETNEAAVAAVRRQLTGETQ
jgi:peptidyl-prolyl cis-trans isomerase D